MRKLLPFFFILLFSCTSNDDFEQIDISGDNLYRTKALDKNNLPDHPCSYQSDDICSTCGGRKPGTGTGDTNANGENGNNNAGGNTEKPKTPPSHICDFNTKNPYCLICNKKNPDYAGFHPTCTYSKGKCSVCGRKQPSNNSGGGGKDMDDKIKQP